MALAAVSSILMARTLMDHGKQNTRRRDLWRAFNAAEAGVAQFQEWAMYPSEYTPNTALFASVASGTTFATKYPTLYTAVHASTTGVSIPHSTLSSMSVSSLNSKYNYNVAKIMSIDLLPPAVGDPVVCDLKIRSLGQGVDGVQRTVLDYATMNPSITIKIPAALISFNGVGVNGNAKVHWGEAWSKNNMNMQAQNQYSYLSTDPNAIFRTEALINSWGGGWATSGKDPDVNLAANYPTQMGLKAPWLGHFYQQIPTSNFDTWGGWPSMDYSTFKSMALAHGRYYSTDASGNIYKNGIEDNAHLVDFLTEFGVANHATAAYDLVFIDTIDGTPTVDHPPTSSNLSTISVNGSNLGLKGVFYLGANFSGTGLNNGASGVTMYDPYGGSNSSVSLFLDGVMYAAGTLALQGGTNIYGSVLAKNGFTGGGTPDIYYNKDLANGLVIGNGNVGSPFKVTLHSNY